MPERWNGMPGGPAGLPRQDFVPPRNDRIKNTACVQSNTAKRQPHYGLLPQVVEGLDLGVAKGAVVYPEVVEGAVEVILGAGDRLA